MFIVTKGKLEHTYENENNIKSIKSLKYGDFFGIGSFFTDDSRENSIRSKNFSTLLEIKKTDFINVIKKNKEDFEKYIMLKDEIKLYNNYKPTQIKCLSGDKHFHLYGECPLIHFKHNSDFIVKDSSIPRNKKETPIFKGKKRGNLMPYSLMASFKAKFYSYHHQCCQLMMEPVNVKKLKLLRKSHLCCP